MTHEQLINRLHKLVERFERQARTEKDLARQTFDSEDPFCEQDSADDPVWHLYCAAALSGAARNWTGSWASSILIDTETPLPASSFAKSYTAAAWRKTSTITRARVTSTLRP